MVVAQRTKHQWANSEVSQGISGVSGRAGRLFISRLNPSNITNKDLYVHIPDEVICIQCGEGGKLILKKDYDVINSDKIVN